jgi:hypothetical protein
MAVPFFEMTSLTPVEPRTDELEVLIDAELRRLDQDVLGLRGNAQDGDGYLSLYVLVEGCSTQVERTDLRIRYNRAGWNLHEIINQPRNGRKGPFIRFEFRLPKEP